MTQEYKQNILEYITGNMEQQVGVNDPQFENITETTNDLYLNLKDYFDSMIFYRAFVPSKDNKNQTLNYSVLGCYGTLVGENDTSGAYVILDENYNIVQVITEYTDGTKIGVIQALNVDEKGNYYAIELRNTTYRVVELNNLVLKLGNQANYQATIVNSFNIPNAYNWDSMMKITRNADKTKYFIIAQRNVSGVRSLVGIDISVGETNTYQYFTTSYSWTDGLSIFNNGYFVYWDSDKEVHFYIAIDYDGLVILTRGTGTTMQQTKYINTHFTNNFNNFIFYSNKIGYYATIEELEDGLNDTFTIYRLDMENLETAVLYQITVSHSSNNQMWLFKSNNTIYYYMINGVEGNDTYTLDFGLINDYAITNQYLGLFEAQGIFYTYCYPNVVSQFNKNKLFIQNQNTLYTAEFIWNSNNYNGSAFKSYGSLVPAKANVLNNDNEEIFNRNLYNLSTYANRYTATLQVPNYFLNNDNLHKTNLISTNNNTLVNSVINKTKNIYEELNINFINQFNIIDNDNNYENIGASSMLVSSMLNTISNAYISKIKINYTDNTNTIKQISLKDITYNNLTATYKMVIYVDKEIDNIEMISDSEIISYKTIPGSDLEVGKYYLITQDLKIE